MHAARARAQVMGGSILTAVRVTLPSEVRRVSTVSCCCALCLEPCCFAYDDSL